MTPHLKYLRYVIRHKWYVFQAGLEIGVPIWQLVIHDWSKFLPGEWFPYVDFFYGKKDIQGRSLGAVGHYHKPGDSHAFDSAWNHHQKANPHHWQYWILIRDTGENLALLMPEKYTREMVADWRGAGMAQGKPDTWAWYLANKDKMTLHSETRRLVEFLLEPHHQEEMAI